MSDAYVYFIQADEAGPIKIGFTSDDPKKRLAQLQTANPASLKLLGSISGTTAREKQLHAALAEWRLQGEWFQSHPTVLATIQEAMTAVHPRSPELCDGPHCSFCGLCQHDTTILIAGDHVVEAYICERCCGRCAKIAARHLLAAAEAIPVPESEAGLG